MGEQGPDLTGGRCVCRWRRDAGAAWRTAYVSVGTLPDGAWYVATVEQVHRPGILVPDEAAAYRVAGVQMRRIGGVWAKVDCYPTEEARRKQPAGG